MIEIKVVYGGGKKTLHCGKGCNLYKILTDGGVNFSAPCGGKGTCGKCRVKIEGAKGSFGYDKSKDSPGGVYLACKVSVYADITVYIADEGAASINTDIKKSEMPFDPVVKTIKISVPLPSLYDQSSDSSRITDRYGYNFDMAALKKLPQLLREGHGVIYASVYENTVYDISLNGDFYGIAIDIGTTTVAACLVDRYGNEKAVYSSLNPQRVFGADVISRIGHCVTEKGLYQVSGVIRKEINNIIEHFNVKISHITVAGNTAMLHLLAGVNPLNIANAPFIPAFTGTVNTGAKNLGINSNAVVTLLPSISAYVGADITAGAAAAGIDKVKETTLFIDIGTNGEMVLKGNGRAVSCSTAAGPAFEGANISCGMGGVSGAINRVYLENYRLKFTTIGGQAAKGICGSGLTDAAAVLLKAGLIGESGAFNEAEDIELKSLADLFVKTPEGRGIKIAENAVLLQSDIRELQLAKSAVCAGILTLADELGISVKDIKKVYLSGGFGSFLNIENAAAIGIIPQELANITEPVGNTSLAGAKYCLINRNFFQRVIKISAETEYIELSCRQKFNDCFMDNMMFDLKD